MTMKIFYKAIFVTGAALLTANAFAAQLEEIVVTAQKREQSLQDVPLSVSAVTGETLEDTGVFDIIDLQATTASLMIPSTGGRTQGASIRLRGFGSPPFQLGIEPAVATYVDGVYRSRSGVAVNDLIDVARIEVLKGPQGTLFGKNTTAGVLHIITNRPSTAEFSGSAEIGYEMYNRFRAKGHVNVPISETAAFRIAGMLGKGDGSQNRLIFDPAGNVVGKEDDLMDLNRSNVHAQLQLLPNESLDVNFSVSWGEIDENCCAAILPENGESLDVIDNTIGNSDTTDLLYSAEVKWQFGNDLTLTSVTAQQDFELDKIIDGEFTQFPFLDIVEHVELKAFTQELRLSGSTDKLQWTVGGFYSDEEIDRIRDFVWLPGIAFIGGTPGLGSRDILFQEGESLSLFAHGIFALSKEFSVTAGLRYNNEDKTGGGELLQPNLNFLGPVNDSYLENVDEDATTGTLSLQYDWSDDVMTYLTYSHGYKAGGINLAREAAGLPGNPSDGPFDAETADSIELGAKTELMNNRLRLNVALFHNEYDDQQNQTLVGQTFVVVNGEGAEVDGLEVEAALSATDSLMLNFGVTILDTEFASGTSFDGGATNAGGTELPWAPDLSASLGWDFNTEISNALSFFWTGSFVYKGEYFASSFSEPDTREDSSSILNTRLGVRSENWSLALWCRNCTDERVAEVKFNNPLFGNPLEYYNRPVEAGITFRRDF